MQNRSISFVQNSARNDIENTNFNSYNYFGNLSNEKEKSKGFDFKFNFRLNNQISGNLKLGTKLRTKSRSYDRHHEFGLINGNFFMILF